MRTPLRLVAFIAVSVSATAGAPLDASAEDPHPGWLVDAVRLEPLAPAEASFAVDGLNRYRGVIELRAGGGVSVINELGLEDYVKGIVEVPATWPAEAQKAQAVAARTYALHQQASTVATPWRDAGADLCATDACQVYEGLASEERENGAAWAAAVQATAGRVLLSGGKPILAEYSSSNGGRSTAGSASYLRAVNDPDDANSPLSRWTFSVPLDQLASLAGAPATSPVVDVARAGDAIVFTVQPAEAEAEPFETSMGVSEFLAAASAHLATPPGLPSVFPTSRFSLVTEGGQVIVSGRGWGHGRGMSQWGAYGKARRGMAASDILAAYYGGIRPTALPEAEGAKSIRVAVALGRRSAAVTGSHLFRVVDGDGTVLASVALGRWTVSTQKGKLRVSPPAGFNEPMTVSATRLGPDRLTAGATSTVYFRLSAPAVVTVRVTGPGLEPESLPPTLVEAGEASVPLPRVRFGGSHEVVIEADAGPGRQATTRVRFSVEGQAVYEASLPAPVGGRLPWVAVAFVLAAAAATACAGSGRRPEAALSAQAVLSRRTAISQLRVRPWSRGTRQDPGPGRRRRAQHHRPG